MRVYVEDEGGETEEDDCYDLIVDWSKSEATDISGAEDAHGATVMEMKDGGRSLAAMPMGRKTWMQDLRKVDK